MSPELLGRSDMLDTAATPREARAGLGKGRGLPGGRGAGTPDTLAAPEGASFRVPSVLSSCTLALQSPQESSLRPPDHAVWRGPALQDEPVSQNLSPSACEDCVRHRSDEQSFPPWPERHPSANSGRRGGSVVSAEPGRPAAGCEPLFERPKGQSYSRIGARLAA